jgi:hypothetical protein
MKITWKTIKGNGPYAYLQRSTVNAQGVPVSKHVAYLGKIGNKVVPMDKISFAGETVVVPKIDGEVFKTLKSAHQDKLYPTWTLSSADVPTEVVAEQFKYWNSQQITNPDGSLKAFKVKHKVITDGVSIEPSVLGLDQEGNPTGKLKDNQSAKTMLAKANAKDARTSGVTMTMTDAPPVTAPKRESKPATPAPYATPSEILLVKDHPYVKNAPDSEKMDVANALVQDIKVAQGEPTIEDVIALRDHPEVKKVAGNERMKIAKNLAYKANIKKAVEQAKEVDEKFTQKYAPSSLKEVDEEFTEKHGPSMEGYIPDDKDWVGGFVEGQEAVLDAVEYTPDSAKDAYDLDDMAKAPAQKEEKVWVNKYGHKASAQTNKPYTASEVLDSYTANIAKGMPSSAKELLEANNVTEQELLIEAQKEGYKPADMDKTAKDAKKSVSASELLNKYHSNEDANFHTENYKLLAERYGTPEQKEKMGLGNDQLVKVTTDWMYTNINPYYNKLVEDVQKEKVSNKEFLEDLDAYWAKKGLIKPAEVTAVPSTMPSAPVPKASEGATKEEKLKTLDAGIDMVKMAVKKEEKKDAELKKWASELKETPEQKKAKADAMKKAVLYVAKTPSYYSGDPETWADGPDGFHDEAEFINVKAVGGWGQGIGPYADKYDSENYFWGKMDKAHGLGFLQNKSNWMKDPRIMKKFPVANFFSNYQGVKEQTTAIYDKETGHAGYITTWQKGGEQPYVKDANFWAWGGTTDDGDPDAVTGKEGKVSNDLINVAMMLNAQQKELLGRNDVQIQEWDWDKKAYGSPTPTNTLTDSQTAGMLLGHKKGYTAGKHKGVIEYTGATIPEQKEIAKKKAEAPKTVNKFGEEVVTVGIHDKTPSQAEWKATGTIMGENPTSTVMTASQVGEISDWIGENKGPLTVGQGFKTGTFSSVQGEIYSSELGKNIEVEGYGFEMGKNPKNVNIIKILKHPSEGIAYVVQGLKVTTAKPQGTLKTETNIFLSDTDIEGNTFANKFPKALATVTGNASMKQVAEFAEPIIKQTKEQSQALTMAQESLLDAVEYTNSPEGEADEVDPILTVGDKVIKTAPDGTKSTWWQISAYNPDGSTFENTEDEPVMFPDGKVPKAIINAQSTGIIMTGKNTGMVSSPMLEKYPKTHINMFGAEQQYLQAQEDAKQDAKQAEKMEAQLGSWQMPTEDNPYKLPMGGIDGMTTVSTEGDKGFVEAQALDAYMKTENILQQQHEKTSMSAKSVQRALMVAQQKKYAFTPWDTTPSNVPWTGEEIYEASKNSFPKYFKSDSTFEKDGAFYDPKTEWSHTGGREFKPTKADVVEFYTDAGQEEAKNIPNLLDGHPEMWKVAKPKLTAQDKPPKVFVDHKTGQVTVETPKTVGFSKAGAGYQTEKQYYPHEEILKHGAQGAKTFGTVKPLEGVGIPTPTGAVKVPIMGMKTIEEEVIQAPAVNEPYNFQSAQQSGVTAGAVNEQGLDKYGSAIVQSVKAEGSGSGLVHKALANKARNQIGIMLKGNEGIKVGDTALNNLTTYNYAKSAGVFPDLMEVLEEDTQEAVKDTEAPFDQFEFSQAIAGVEKENETADLFVNAVDDPAVKEMEEEDKHGYGEWWDDTKVSTVFNSGRSWYTGRAGADEDPETLRIVSKEQVKRMIPAVVKGHYDLQERINKTIHATALNDTVSASERHKWYKNKKIRDALTNYALGRQKIDIYVKSMGTDTPIDWDHANQIADTMRQQAVWTLDNQGISEKNAELIVNQLEQDVSPTYGDKNLLDQVTSHDGGYIPAPTDPFITKYLKPTKQVVKKEVEGVIGYEVQTPEEVEGATTPLTTQKGVQPKINKELVTQTPSGKPHLSNAVLNQLRSKALVGIGAVNDYANTLKLSKPAKKSLDAVVADLADQIGDTTGGQGQMVKDIAQGKVKGVDPTKPLETEVSRKKFEALKEKVQKANAKGNTVKWDDDLKYKSGSKGSNEGALYESKGLGKPVYVKWNKSSLHNKNEILANRLYELFGVPVPTVHEAVVNGKEGVLSQWVSGAKPMTQGEMSAHPDVHQGFIADAWLGNWDVAGQGYDNIVKTGTAQDVGDAYRIDTGGALLFRAQGNPKNVINGSDFGKDVTELETLVDGTNMQSKNVFASLTDEQKVQGAKTLGGITDYMIDKVVDDANIPESIPNDVKNAYASNATYLSRLPKNPNAFYKERLKERRDNILQKVLGQGPVAEVPKNVLLGMSELSPSSTTMLINGIDTGDSAIFRKTMKTELGSETPYKALKKYYNAWKHSTNTDNGQVLRVASATANYHPDNPELGLKEGLAELDAFLKTAKPIGRKKTIEYVTDIIKSKEGEDLINAIKASGQIHKVYFAKTLGTNKNVTVNEQPLVRVERGWKPDQVEHELSKILESQGIDPHDKSKRPKLGDYIIYDKNPSAHSWSINNAWENAQKWQGYVPYEAVFISDRLSTVGNPHPHEDEVVFCCPVSQMKIVTDSLSMLEKDWKKK